ncbi:MAG: hypothetical protein WC367_00395 [Methanoregula sp.]|jgi:hypothetical protein
MNARDFAGILCGIFLAVFAGWCLIAGFGALGIAGHYTIYPAPDSNAVAVYSRGITLDVPLPSSPAIVPQYRVAAVLQDAGGNGTGSVVRTQIPSVGAALALAGKALEPYGGLPADAVLEKSEQVFGYEYDTKTGTAIKQYPQYTLVMYRQYVNGSLVMPSQVSVALGENGTLLDYSKDWYVLEPAGEIPVLSAEEALEKLKKQDLFIPLQCCITDRTITQIQFGYYITVHSPYIREEKPVDTCTPVWVFYGIKPGTGTGAFPLYINATRG